MLKQFLLSVVLYSLYCSLAAYLQRAQTQANTPLPQAPAVPKVQIKPEEVQKFSNV